MARGCVKLGSAKIDVEIEIEIFNQTNDFSKKVQNIDDSFEVKILSE